MPKQFSEGYLDGWHTIEPGSDPSVPAHAIPAGKTDYQHGYDLGREAALDFQGKIDTSAKPTSPTTY